MSERDKIIRELQARAKAAKKRVFGYCSDKAGCELAKGTIPDDWDRLAVEGDKRWSILPPATEVARNDRGR